MTMFDGTVAGVSYLFGPRRKVPSAEARRRRVNPLLWALGPLALYGYLMIGHPADVLNAALGTVLAAGWLIAGAWVGIRSAPTSLDEPSVRDGRAGPQR